MATSQRIEIDGKRYTQKGVQNLVKALKEEIEVYQSAGRCQVCGRFLPSRKFPALNDPRFVVKTAPICRDCLEKIFYRIGEDGVKHEPTKESLIEGLNLLNKPFLQDEYEKVSRQWAAQKRLSLPSMYLKNLALLKDGHSFSDSDFFQTKPKVAIDENEATHSNDEEVLSTHQQILSDREDVVRMIGYDPFVEENYSDQSFLYSQLLGILDSSDDTSDDQMKIQSAISIVRSFLQVSKIDDSLAKLMQDSTTLKKNASDISKLQDSKGKIQAGITRLAAESCISLKNAKGGSRGDNTWTGKIKKCKDLGLRASENNGYDLKTCKGMIQCAEISSNAIIKALKLDESDYSDMLAQQREMLVKLEYQAMKAEEAVRILLRENLDLKDLLMKNEIDITNNLVDLDELLTSVDEEADGRISLGDDG